MTTQANPYQMCERLHEALPKIAAIREFLAWAQEERIVLAELSKDDTPALIFPGTTDELILRHFRIDMKRADAERLAMIEERDNAHRSGIPPA